VKGKNRKRKEEGKDEGKAKGGRKGGKKRYIKGKGKKRVRKG
jgi:hypothetical protein